MFIAIYSGSFNPIHNGHIAIAEAALSEGSDEVWMVVSPQNPHKNDDELWPFEIRYKLVEKCFENKPNIKVSDCENNLPRPSYTIHTLQYLQKLYPQHKFRLLIGGDNLLNFHLWKEYEQILDSFGLIVYPRSSKQVDNFSNHPKIQRIEARLLDISSSDIRKKLANNQPIHGLVPVEVEKYIYQYLKSDPTKSDF